MTVSSATTRATATLNAITKAAVSTPRKPIVLNRDVAQALEKKLVALAKRDAPKASGLVDLMQELKDKGLITVTYDKDTMPIGNSNAFNIMMNNVKTVLNNNAVSFDDKPLSPMMR